MYNIIKINNIELSRIYQDIDFKAVILYGDIDYKKIYQYANMKCKKTEEAPFVCNGCPNKNKCRKNKFAYRI